ncbi:MAG: translation initiation factor IF-6 [Candidatus Aenigmatarchaeota archaeon]
MPVIDKINFDGSVNLGLHAETTDSFCLINPSLSGKCYDEVKEVLDVETIKTTIAGCKMTGILAAANKHGVAVPQNIEKSEKMVLEDNGIDYKVIRTKHTALGNMILVNDEACIISEKISDKKEELEELFQVPVKTATIAGLETLGTTGVVTNRGFLSHRDTTDEEMKRIEDHFSLRVGIGTANFGSVYVGAALLANSKGVLTSHRTTGPEIGRIDQALISTE